MRSQRYSRDESGLSLIELMVSMFLISIIFAAVAASLVTSARATTDNERRVQATALLNRLHEELQSTPWFDAANYELEADALTDPATGIADALDGRPLVTLEGPSTASCPAAEPECNRRSRVPRAYFTTEIDGRDYEVFQAVTWTDATEQVKRFTTVVRWQVLDRQLEERFESERVATAAEAGDPTLPRVIQFQVGPSPMNLTPLDAPLPDRNSQDIRVVVRFSQPVDSAQLRFYSVKEPATDSAGKVQLGERTVALTPRVFDPSGKPIEFETTIDAEAYRFPEGPRRFRAIGTLGTETFSGSTSMTFLDGSLPATADPDVTDGSGGGGETEPPEDEEGLPDPPATPVGLGQVNLSRTEVCMNANHQFRQDLRVWVSVEGMTVDDHDVSVTYTADGLTRTQALSPANPTVVDHTGATFELVLAAGKDHGFRPQGNGSNAKDQTQFTVTATRRSDKGSAGPVSSGTFTATAHQC